MPRLELYELKRVGITRLLPCRAKSRNQSMFKYPSRRLLYSLLMAMLMYDVQSLVEDAPKAQKLRGLIWLFLGMGLIHMFNCGLAWMVIPQIQRFGPWDVLVLLLMGLVGLAWIESVKARGFRQVSKTALLQAAFADSFAILLFGVLALFALRLGLEGLAFGLGVFGLVWLGVAFARLAARL